VASVERQEHRVIVGHQATAVQVVIQVYLA